MTNVTEAPSVTPTISTEAPVKKRKSKKDFASSLPVNQTISIKGVVYGIIDDMGKLSETARKCVLKAGDAVIDSFESVGNVFAATKEISLRLKLSEELKTAIFMAFNKMIRKLQKKLKYKKMLRLIAERDVILEAM